MNVTKLVNKIKEFYEKLNKKIPKLNSKQIFLFEYLKKFKYFNN